MTIKVNHAVPATMSYNGLEYLARLAQSVPENGVIVEIGPLFGSSTWVLSKNAPASARIFSIDTWEPAQWIDKVEKKYRGCKPFSKDAFLHYTRDCPNVTAIQGWSPEIVSDWDLPIDLFFDDATHGDPGFSANVNFFLPYVKDRAILCGDDYSRGWPDIVRVVDDLAHKWQTEPEVIGRVWSIRKPSSASKAAEPVQLSIESKRSTPIIHTQTESFSGRKYDLSPEVWSGATHKKDPLRKIRLSLEAADQLVLNWGVRTNNGEVHENLVSGDVFEASPSEWICGIWVKLSGEQADQYVVDYEATYTMHDGRGRRYNSIHASLGTWLQVGNKSLALSALRVTVVSTTDKAEARRARIKHILVNTSPAFIYKKLVNKLYNMFRID